MSKEKSPAFQFYPKDFLVDENVATMSLQEVGAYILLLCHAWIERGIPADPTALARLCRVSTAAFTRFWPRLEPLFPDSEAESGRLFNRRQEEERQKQEAYRQGQSESGKVGANRRWHTDRQPIGSPSILNGVAIDSPMANGIAKHGSPSPSSTPSPEENPPTPLAVPWFDQFRRAYEYTGKPMNEPDWDLAYREWISQDLDLIGRQVVDQLASDVKFSWEDLRRNHEYNKIKFPVNWLKAKPWTRKQAARTA